MTDKPIESKCPYCSSALKKVPQRKTKCPSCGKFMFVKSPPDTRIPELVTEERAAEIDALWSEKYSRDERSRILVEFDLSESRLDQLQKKLSDESGKPVLYKQALATLLGETAEKTAQLHTRKMMYFQMALLMDELGLDFRPILTKVAETELLDYRQKGFVTHVKIVTAGKNEACDACQLHSGKVFTISDALLLKPIPCQDCTKESIGGKFGYCRCSYVAVI